MASDGDVGTAARDLLSQYVALRLEYPPIDDSRAAVDDAEFSARIGEMERLRKSSHPCAHIPAHASVGIRVPALGQRRAFGTVLEIAGTVLGSDGKLLLAVSLDDMAAPFRDEPRGIFGCRAIGHDIARADDIARGDG